MSEETDVVIAGGGFAGLAAAESCAELGTACLVLERNSEIGYPIHTSGGSFIPDLKELDIPQELYHPVDSVEFVSPSRRAMFDYDRPKFCVIDVRGVRQHLAERAIDAGAEIEVETTVVDVLPGENGSGVSGVIVRDAYGKREIPASVTIDATGFQSIVAQNAGLHDGFDRFGRGLEYDLFAPDYDSQIARLLVGETLIPGGYAWIFPYSEDRIRVGVGSLFPDADTRLRDSMEKVLSEYSDLGIDRTAQLERHSGVIPSTGTPTRSVADGVLLAGDAANFPFGLVGEGIRMALDTGQAAGRTAARGVRAGDTSQRGLQAYEDHWQSEYSESLKVSAMINQRLAKLNDRQWDKGTRMLQELGPDEFYRLLRSDFSTWNVLRLVRSNPRLLKSLGEVLVKSKLFDDP